MRWVIDRPSMEQIKDSLSRIEDPMQSAEVRDLISRMAPGGHHKPTKTALSLGATAAPSKTEDQIMDRKNGKRTLKDEKKRVDQQPAQTVKSRSPLKQRIKVATLVAGLFLLSAGVAAWLNSDALKAFTGPAVVPIEPDKTPEPAPVAAPAAVATAETSKDEAQPLAYAEAATEATKGTEPKENIAATVPAPQPEKVYALMTPEERQQAKLDNEPDPKKKSNSKSDSKSVNKTSDKTTKTTKTPEPEIELPAGALEGQAWVKSFTRGTFVVQHTSSETFAKARDRQKRFPNLSEAKVVPQFEADQNQAKFALISGPFESKELADTFLKTENMPKESWVRSSRAIQKRLVPNTSETTKP
jgi:hypothetical protein